MARRKERRAFYTECVVGVIVLAAVVYFAGYLCLVGAGVALVGCIVQAARKTGTAWKWGIAAVCFAVGFAVCAYIIQDAKDDESEQPSAMVETADSKYATVAGTDEMQTVDGAVSEEELTEAEKFAQDNGVSLELARDIEYALSRSKYSYKLHQVYEWKQIDDWAEGQRYTGWMDMEYIWVFYVKGDKVESIRQQKGLEFIYQAE